MSSYRHKLAALVAERADLFGPEAWDSTDCEPPAAAVIAALGEAGLLAPTLRQSAALHEELAPLPAGAVVLTHVEVGTRLLAAFQGTAEQAAQAAAGQLTAALAVTEPTGGLDFDAMTTALRGDGPTLELSGEKWFSSNAAFADELLVLARDGRFPDTALGRHTLLRVPARTAGVTVQPLRTLGHRGLTGHLRFDGVRLPADAVLGARGSGLLTLIRHWVHERVMLAVRAATMADWLLASVPPAAARADLAHLADLAGEVIRERAAYGHAMDRLAAGRCTPTAAAGCKLRAVRLLRRTADAVLQLDGTGTGPAERVLRDALGLALAGGSEEALLMHIARELR